MLNMRVALCVILLALAIFPAAAMTREGKEGGGGRGGGGDRMPDRNGTNGVDVDFTPPEPPSNPSIDSDAAEAGSIWCTVIAVLFLAPALLLGIYHWPENKISDIMALAYYQSASPRELIGGGLPRVSSKNLVSQFIYSLGGGQHISTLLLSPG